MKFKPGEPPLSFDDITAHAVSFFGDGFETSSITISFLLYDMAANIDAQEQLRSEINEIILKHGGSLTYDAIQEMTFLDRALSGNIITITNGTYILIIFYIFRVSKATSSCNVFLKSLHGSV